MRLPKLKHGSGIRTTEQMRFGGLNHTKSASEGDIYDMCNMSSKDYPLISTRTKRALISSGEDVKAVGDKWIIKGTDFIYDGEVKNEFMPLSDTPKQVIEMGAYIIIFPDKYYYNAEEDKPFVESVYELNVTKADPVEVDTDLTDVGLENVPVWVYTTRKEWEKAVAYRYKDDQYSNRLHIRGTSAVALGKSIKTAKGFGNLEVALSGEIKTSGSYDDDVFECGGSYRALVAGLREGDGMLFRKGELEQSAVVKSVDQSYVRFEKGTLTSWAGTVEGLRHIPDFEFVLACENRLWGVWENTIYASKLGDPKNFYVYQGLSTDSWAVDYLTKIFTGAVVYGGKPTFWTESSVIAIYGDTPLTYQAKETNLNGVFAGNSMAIAGGYLYYLSPSGMCVYGGQYPTDIHVPIGEKIGGGFGFTDGKKYYLDAGSKLYVYDPTVHLWHIENSEGVCNYNTKDGILSVVTTNGDLLGFTDEGNEIVDSFVEFGDFYLGTGDKKAMSKLNIRIEAEEGTEVDILVRYDSADEWQNVKTLSATKKRSFYIPFVPCRCDHYRLRFEGKGTYTIYSISRENYIGSAN